MNPVNLFIETDLKRLESAHLLRHQKLFRTPQLPISNVDGKNVHLFSSSNYLSFGEKEWVLPAGNLGAGSGGSRLTTGNQICHEELEDELATLFGTESSVLFSTGYAANLGVLSALGKDATIFSDEKNHASIIDGCRLARAKISVYHHLDYEDLEAKLASSSAEKKLIVSDGVFSMDGDILDLPRFVALGEKYAAFTVVDDAHGLGVIGARGFGIVEHFGNAFRPDLLVSTMSKAIGSEGGFVLANNHTCTYLRNTARSYIFSTALSPLTIARIRAAFRKLSEDSTAVEKLRANIHYLQSGLKSLSLPVGDPTAIIPIPIGDEARALAVANALWDDGFFLTPIRFPAVPQGQAILRLTLMADHTQTQLDALLAALKKHL